MLNLTLLEVKDEIISGEAKYNVYDKDGKLLYENCSISLSNEIIQEGTPLNKVLFDSVNSALIKISEYLMSNKLGDDTYSFLTKGEFYGLAVSDTLNDKFRLDEF